MAEMKKNAQINKIMQIKQKLWIVLPILLVIIFISTIFVGVAYFLKSSELKDIKETKTNLDKKMSEYNSKKNELLAYSNMKNAYNSYINSIINYELVFNTIEKYIPKDSTRSSFWITTKGSNVNVILNTELVGYEQYMTFLRVLDKCSFSSEEQKKSILNVQRVELGWEQWSEVLSEPVSININFNFSTATNEFILQKKYDKTVRQLNDLWKFINFINISKWLNPDVFNQQADYSDELKRFYSKKEEFAKKISEIQNTDENWFFKNNTWENFISKIKRETTLIDLLIAYYNDYKTTLNQNVIRIFDNWDITYKDPTTNKVEIVLNLKDVNNKYIIEINETLLKLNILKKYNEYLLDGNYLDTFEKISKNATKKYSVIINNEKKELSSDEYITYIIGKYKILDEKDELLSWIISDEKIVTKNWKSEFEKISAAEIDKSIKAKYTEYMTFAKSSDAKKVELLNIDIYLKSFYKDYAKYNLYNDWVIILNYFFNKTKLDTQFLNSIKYPFFNFAVKEDLLTYKKRFLLTIENNRTLSAWINKINTPELLITEISNTENFIKKTTDIILAWHNNIDCIYKDVKMETKDIYTSVLKSKQEEQEKIKNTKEIDIIINSINDNEKQNNNTTEKK